MLTPRHTLLFVFSCSHVHFKYWSEKLDSLTLHIVRVPIVVDQFLLVLGCAILGHTVGNALHLFLPWSAHTKQKSKTWALMIIYSNNVHGANRLWGDSSVGWIVSGSRRPWGEMPMGRNVYEAKCPSMGWSVHWVKCPWGKKSWHHHVCQYCKGPIAKKAREYRRDACC